MDVKLFFKDVQVVCRSRWASGRAAAGAIPPSVTAPAPPPEGLEEPEQAVELVVVQTEIGEHPGVELAGRPADDLAALRRDLGQHGPAVGGVGPPPHEALDLEAVDGVRDARLVHLQARPRL